MDLNEWGWLSTDTKKRLHDERLVDISFALAVIREDFLFFRYKSV